MIMGVGAGVGVLLAGNLPAHAQDVASHMKSATAVTQVFGDGLRFTAVAVEYDRPVDGAKLSSASFRVDGRTVTDLFVSTSPDPADRAAQGRYVIVALSPDDPAAALKQRGQAEKSAARAGKAPGGPSGPLNGPPAGGPKTVYKPAEATVIQAGPVIAVDGETYPPTNDAIATTNARNLVVDDFRQLEFHDLKTGDVLQYNLFVPKDYNSARTYPLVLFMHDAGATGSDPLSTLRQGLGAVIWASPGDQAKRPALVLAPQYSELIVNDQSETTSMLDTTIDLVNQLAEEYSVDRNRLYATGQSGGCMMSIAMNIKYPDFFAASFLVAGQWDPALVKPLARQKLWIMVSQGDLKAYPGQNAITAVLEQEGVKISRAVWDGTSTPEEFQTAFEKMDIEKSSINYVALRKGTVVPPGQSDAGGGEHINTWRIAYTIAGVRDWIFRQHK
jgi:predicted peptidase